MLTIMLHVYDHYGPADYNDCQHDNCQQHCFHTGCPHLMKNIQQTGKMSEEIRNAVTGCSGVKTFSPMICCLQMGTQYMWGEAQIDNGFQYIYIEIVCLCSFLQNLWG